jgi:membrane associated rhomboid family serine protease
VWYDPPVPRVPSYRSISYSFGPGPITPAIKWLIWTNVIVFLIEWIFPLESVRFFALTPSAVFSSGWLWQVVTYMFLHADPVHLLLNMLTLWMFGVELERMWGTQAFLRYYFLCGIGAGISTLVVSLLPFEFANSVYLRSTVGASGGIYGLLLAYGIIFRDRPIYMWFLFPVPARWFVIITGALVLWSSVTDPTGGTAHMAHLGGMLFGYVYLKRGRGGPWLDLKYRYTKWRMNRLRKRFDVHHGGRGRSTPPPGGWTH